MSILVVCESRTGNTQKIAEVLAKTLQADLLTPQEALHVDLRKYKLVGFGSGIYNGQHDPALFTLLKAQNYHKQDAFVFSTSGLGILLYHAPLRELLLRKGFEVRYEFTCKGRNSHGPFGLLKRFNLTLNQNHPNAKDLHKAELFAQDLLIKLGLF